MLLRLPRGYYFEAGAGADASKPRSTRRAVMMQSQHRAGCMKPAAFGQGHPIETDVHQGRLAAQGQRVARGSGPGGGCQLSPDEGFALNP